MRKHGNLSAGIAKIDGDMIVRLDRTTPRQAPPRVQRNWNMAAAMAEIPLADGRVHPLTRLIEVIVACVVLVVTTPVMLVIGLIIRVGSPGPALFRQKRVGINGELFDFVKFRTLYHDAKDRFPQLYDYDYNTEQLQQLTFKVPDDPRVTPQGEWLRRSTLDELPNFWAVLTGDMALVGPRPEIPEMLQHYHGDMLEKLTVRPGITGIAQVSGRGRLGFYDTVKLDVEYVRQRSVWLDIKILCKTIRVCLCGDGAY